jgi:hypothetical protein
MNTSVTQPADLRLRLRSGSLLKVFLVLIIAATSLVYQANDAEARYGCDIASDQPFVIYERGSYFIGFSGEGSCGYSATSIRVEVKAQRLSSIGVWNTIETVTETEFNTDFNTVIFDRNCTVGTWRTRTTVTFTDGWGYIWTEGPINSTTRTTNCP